MALPVRTPPAADASVAAWADYASTILGDVSVARASATTEGEHGSYEPTRQAALVIADAAARITLARLQLVSALAALAPQE